MTLKKLRYVKINSVNSLYPIINKEMVTLKSVIKIKRHSFLLMKVEKQKNMKKYGLK